MTVGDRIRRTRLVMGLSQVELADKMGVSKQTLYKYENNIITNIPSDKIERAAYALGTTPESLMGWDKEPSTSAIYPLILLEMDKMNDDGLNRLLMYAKDIQDKYRKDKDDATEEESL